MSEFQVSCKSLSIVHRKILQLLPKSCIQANVNNSVQNLTKQNYLKCICLKELISNKLLDNFMSHFLRYAIIQCFNEAAMCWDWSPDHEVVQSLISMRSVFHTLHAFHSNAAIGKGKSTKNSLLKLYFKSIYKFQLLK